MTDIDRSLAFTALLETTPEFGKLSMGSAEMVTTDFLAHYRRVVEDAGRVVVGESDMMTVAHTWGRSYLDSLAQQAAEAADPVGTITYGSGHYADEPEGHTGGPAVLQRVLPDNKRYHIKYQYRVLLAVDSMWQAQAIAAILNSK